VPWNMVSLGEKSNRGELGWAEVVLGSGHAELAYPRFGRDVVLTGEGVGVVGWVLRAGR